MPHAQYDYRRDDGARLTMDTYQPFWTATLADGTTRRTYVAADAVAWIERQDRKADPR